MYKEYLKPKTLESVQESCPNDKFENAIREFGIGNACEWFGYVFDGPFAEDVVQTLKERFEEAKDD